VFFSCECLSGGLGSCGEALGKQPSEDSLRSVNFILLAEVLNLALHIIIKEPMKPLTHFCDFIFFLRREPSSFIRFLHL
jgi:hypothetical protein